MENDPRIGIYLTDYTELGGVERVTANLIKLLKDNNYNIGIIISKFKKYNSPKLDYGNDIKFHIINNLNKMELSNIINQNKLTHLIIQIQNLSDSHRIAKIAKNNNCTPILILHTSPFVYFKTYKSCEEIFTSVRSFAQYLKMKLYWVPKHYLIFKDLINNTKIYCVSKQAAKELNEIMGKKVDKNNIDYIYNVLSFSTIDTKYKKENIILYAGRLSYEKRILKMIDIWKLIYHKNKEWHFYIIGEGEYKSTIEKYISKYNVKNINLISYTKDIDYYLKKSKINILLSYYEGLPTILLEASSFKNALVSYNGDGGIIDIVKDEYNGYLIKSNCNKYFANKILYLIENEEILTKMGENAYKFLENFSHKSILIKWENIFKNQDNN